jgi:2,4-dienoyl-CoA reductase-like NADH-dependent reductase (Old Yellow Enzyme family)
MSSSALFKPIKIGSLDLANRVVIAPMCQHSAAEGCMNDWHLIHLGHLALSGAALLTIEATAVTAEGRITYADVGLYSDATESAMGRILDAIRQWSKMPIGIQLSHAGRKASREVPWKGGAQLSPEDPFGWSTVAPSDTPFEEGNVLPTALDRAEMRQISEAFVTAAIRSARLGIDLIQLHAAHGYLLHQFLSPLSNHRDDEYGGSTENRMRFPLEVFEAVREVFPVEKPVSFRVSATDWIPGGWDLPQTIAFAQALEELGCNAIHTSSGGTSLAQRFSVGPNYQVPLARAVKASVSIPVVAVGLITGFEQAEAIVFTEDADMVALARTILYNPRWRWRTQPRNWEQLFGHPISTSGLNPLGSPHCWK